VLYPIPRVHLEDQTMAVHGATRHKPFYSRPKAAAAKAKSRRRAPPSSALINAVLERSDLRDDLGGGRVLLRLSPGAQADVELRRTLGAEAARLADVAVIWDERDEVVFRVLDGGPAPMAPVPAPTHSEDDRFVLTPAALAYIAHSQGARRA
jgi:hypothetical protein